MAVRASPVPGSGLAGRLLPADLFGLLDRLDELARIEHVELGESTGAADGRFERAGHSPSEQQSEGSRVHLHRKVLLPVVGAVIDDPRVMDENVGSALRAARHSSSCSMPDILLDFHPPAMFIVFVRFRSNNLKPGSSRLRDVEDSFFQGPFGRPALPLESRSNPWRLFLFRSLSES